MFANGCHGNIKTDSTLYPSVALSTKLFFSIIHTAQRNASTLVLFAYTVIAMNCEILHISVLAQSSCAVIYSNGSIAIIGCENVVLVV